jgi:hypothetical protein
LFSNFFSDFSFCASLLRLFLFILFFSFKINKQQVEQPLRSSSHGGDLYPRDRAWRLHLRPNDPLDARDREGKWFESVVVARGAVSELAPPLVKRTGMGIPQRTTLEQQVAQQPSADAVVVHFKVRMWC